MKSQMFRPGAAEFPHANRRLDCGALWIGTALCWDDTESATAPDPVASFLRAVVDVAIAHGAPEAAKHAEYLFQFGSPAPAALDPSATAALIAGNILETSESGVRPTEWFTSTSNAWRSVLRGEGDLAACGDVTLDTWTAELVARLVAQPEKAQAIRKDLRKHGVAAFGMA